MPPNNPEPENQQYETFRKMIIARPAQCLWQTVGPKMYSRRHGGTRESELEAWTIAGRLGIIIVHIFPDEGIDLYTNETPSSWDEIEKLLGPTDEERRAAAKAAEVSP